jgi:hypothetical protein
LKEFIQSCVEYLAKSADYEETDPIVSDLWLLVLSRELLIEYISTELIKGTSWWAMRCLFVHQRVLNHPSASIRAQILHWIERAERNLKLFDNETRSLFYTEVALIAQYYHHMDFEVSKIFKKNGYSHSIGYKHDPFDRHLFVVHKN